MMAPIPHFTLHLEPSNRAPWAAHALATTTTKLTTTPYTSTTVTTYTNRLTIMRAILTVLIALHSFALAQLALPSPPWLPPDSSDGASVTTGDEYPNPQWSSLLGSLLYFYEAQRSGELPSTKRVSWRNASTLDDGREDKLDLSGAYTLLRF